jgi:hypothetical protein
MTRELDPRQPAEYMCSKVNEIWLDRVQVLDRSVALPHKLHGANGSAQIRGMQYGYGTQARQRWRKSHRNLQNDSL